MGEYGFSFLSSGFNDKQNTISSQYSNFPFDGGLSAISGLGEPEQSRSYRRNIEQTATASLTLLRDNSWKPNSQYQQSNYRSNSVPLEYLNVKLAQESESQLQLLEQRVKLLEHEKEELMQREESQKNINENIIAALNSIDTESGGSVVAVRKQFEDSMAFLQDKQTKELNQLKQAHEMIVFQLNAQISEILDRQQQGQLKIQSLTQQLQQISIQREQKEEAESETLKKAKFTEESWEKQKHTLLDQIRQGAAKIANLQEQLESMRQQANFFRQEQHGQTERNLQEIRLANQHEKEVMWTKVNTLQSERNIAQSSYEQSQEIITQLKRKAVDDQEEHEGLIKAIRQRVECLERECAKISVLEALQKAHEQALKQKDHIIQDRKQKCKEHLKQMNLEQKKFEQIEKNLQYLLREKDGAVEDIKKETGKKLALEKLRADNLHEAAVKVKDEYTKRNAFVIQEIIAKEECIKTLNKQLLTQSTSANRRPSHTRKPSTENNTSAQKGDLLRSSTAFYQRSAMTWREEGQPSQTDTSTMFLTELAQRFGSPTDIRNHSPKSIDDSYFKAVSMKHNENLLSVRDSHQSMNFFNISTSQPTQTVPNEILNSPHLQNSLTNSSHVRPNLQTNKPANFVGLFKQSVRRESPLREPGCKVVSRSTSNSLAHQSQHPSQLILSSSGIQETNEESSQMSAHQLQANIDESPSNHPIQMSPPFPPQQQYPPSSKESVQQYIYQQRHSSKVKERENLSRMRVIDQTYRQLNERATIGTQISTNTSSYLRRPTTSSARNTQQFEADEDCSPEIIPVPCSMNNSKPSALVFDSYQQNKCDLRIIKGVPSQELLPVRSSYQKQLPKNKLSSVLQLTSALPTSEKENNISYKSYGRIASKPDMLSDSVPSRHNFITANQTSPLFTSPSSATRIQHKPQSQRNTFTQQSSKPIRSIHLS